jgi:ankyrin repeat protein
VQQSTKKRCQAQALLSSPCCNVHPAPAALQACRHGHLPVVRLLLRRGADAGLADMAGNTPAHLAVRHGHLDLLATLLQAGAHTQSLPWAASLSRGRA